MKFTSRIFQELLKKELLEATVYRVDMDRVDVAPLGSSGILRGLPLTGDRDKIKPGDPVRIVTIGNERVALAPDVALDFAEEEVIQPVAEAARFPGLEEALMGGIASGSGSSGSGSPLKLTEDFSGSAGNGPYTLANTFYAGSLNVYLNGLLARATEIVDGGDYQSFSFNIAGRTISATDQITAVYMAGTALYNTTDADTVDGLHAAESGADAHVVATAADGTLTAASANIGALVVNPQATINGTLNATTANITSTLNVGGNLTLTAGATLALPQNGNITGALCGFDYMVDGGGAVPTAGDKGFVQVPFGMHVAVIDTLGNAVGSINCSVYKCTYANYGTWTLMTSGIGTASALKNSQAVSFDIATTEIIYVNLVSCSANNKFTLSFRGYRI